MPTTPRGLCFAQLISGAQAAPTALLQRLRLGLLGGNQLHFPLHVKQVAAGSWDEPCSAMPHRDEGRGVRVKILPLKDAGASVLVTEDPLLKMINALSCSVAVSFQNENPDTGCSSVRTLIYMTDTQITNHGVGLAIGQLPLSSLQH